MTNRTGQRRAMSGAVTALRPRAFLPNRGLQGTAAVLGRRLLPARPPANGLAARSLLIRGARRADVALSRENVALPSPTPDNAQPQIDPGLSWRFQDARSDVKGGLCPAVRGRRGRWVCGSALLRRRAAQQDPHDGAAQVGSTPHCRPPARKLSCWPSSGGTAESSPPRRSAQVTVSAFHCRSCEVRCARGSCLYLIVLFFVVGVVVGALARLLLPGPDPMGIGLTALVGLCGAVSAGLFSWYVLHRHGAGLVLSVVFSMLVVWI